MEHTRYKPATWLDETQLIDLVKRYPAMADIVAFPGTIGEFYQRFVQPFQAASAQRQRQVLQAIAMIAEQVFHKDEVESIMQSLQRNYLVSTAEHHASITYGQTFNVVLNQYLIQSQHKLPLVSLSCATTTLDNELFPRGVFYEQERLPFLSKSHKYYFASDAPPINGVIFRERVRKLQNDGILNKEEARFLNEWLDEELPILSRWDTLSLQISVLNQRLWRAMVSAELLYPGCEYFMIPAEDVVTCLLQADVEAGGSSWVAKAIFDPSMRDCLYSTLNGIRLCWDRDGRKGTFLFWGYDKKRKPLQLFLHDNTLVSSCRTVNVPLVPDAIVRALKAQEIVPASNLCCLYLTFFGGLTLMGGLLQVNYLGEMQQRLVQENALSLSNEDLDIIRQVKTNLYVNFQELPWNAGGLQKTLNTLTAQDLHEYQQFDHLTQLHECLYYLANV